MIIQYQDYVQQIRAFSRSSMIYSSTETSWSIWKRLLDNRLKTDEKPEEIIVKAHVPRIFSISVATGNNHREKLATLGDIVKLSHNYLGVFESINNKKIIESETQDILKYLEESKFIPYPSTDHLKEIAHATVGGLFLQRTFRSQWDSSSYSIHHVPRLWRIFQLLDSQLDGVPTQIARKIFGMDPIHTVRSAFGLYTMADQSKPLGIVDLSIKSCDPEIIEKLNIDMETLKLIARKISADSSKFRAWHDTLKIIPKHYRKYAPIPLYDSPLYWEKENEFICPSPDIFIASISDIIFREFRSNPGLFPNIDISVEIGNAFHEYVAEILPHLFPLAKINDWSKLTHSRKNADFVVETDQEIFVIEAKRSIGGTTAKTICSPKDVVFVWERLFQSFQQCAETIKEIRKQGISTKTIFSFVVVESSVLGDAELFCFYAHHVGILKELGLESIEVLSIEHFERLIISSSIEEIKNKILEKWKQINENPVMKNFYFIRTSNIEKITLPFLDDCFKSLFSA